MVYLFWFWVHFTVLTKSGTGNDFMSPAFQQTLQDSPLTALAEGEWPVPYAIRDLLADALTSRRDPLLRHADDQAQGDQGFPALAPGALPSQVR